MDVLFIGGYRNPGGPNEVNRNLLKFLPSNFHKLELKRTIFQLIESVFKIFSSDIVIFSGLMFNKIQVNLAKKLNKKIIYIMHGCAKLELGTENMKEELILESSDYILCVSDKYSHIIKNIFPQCANKIKILQNGINWAEIDTLKANNQDSIRDSNRIILFGGGRKEKQNYYVCKAVQELNNEKSTNLTIDIYGYFRDYDDSKLIAEIPCVTFNNVIPHSEVNIELLKSNIFIQNSKFESFGLAVIDAICLGCNALISQNVGALDIIKEKKDIDIIYDPTDIDEIKHKLLNLISMPNNYRLLNSIDKEKTSLEYAAKKLTEYCSELYEK
ncbi:glycosyltransferase family 4 protein [Muribaculum intestinale]|uniref:glycosyltransferase family 4 protein n=1 Tax=Muribaculum intestinale TaxID=1796646 RepID=UPI0025A96446|nr:glycosyltransferase family 4 protein [Muribaculum intestinale]